MTRWRCRSYRVALVEYADDTLTDAARRRVDRHLATCDACRHDVAALRELPAALRALEVPDPGEEFWLAQRHAIGRRIRALPAPGAGGPLGWLRAAWRASGWRYPVAVAVSASVALVVYRLAEQAQSVAPPPPPQVAALDRTSLLALHEVAATVVSQDDDLPPASSQDDAVLAAVPLSGFVDAEVVPESLGVDDLSDTELDSVDSFIGDVG